MKRLLVPLDGSALADAALEHAASLANPDAEVVIVRVLRDDESPAGRDAARTHLAGVQARLGARGARPLVVVREGDPAAEVLAEIRRAAPELVVMSSHGRGGVMRWVRGSVAERVLRCAEAPVLVLTPEVLAGGQVRPFRRILVAVDGGGGAAPAPAVLPVVEELARRHGAEVVLVRVLTPRTLPSLFGRDPAVRLRPSIARLEAQGIPVQAFGGYGDPASEILDTAEYHDCDVIALTTAGRSGVDAWLHPSVTDKVLRHARRPLLVVRAPGAA